MRSTVDPKSHFRRVWFNQIGFTLPIASMYGIVTYIYRNNQPNVGKFMDCMGYAIPPDLKVLSHHFSKISPFPALTSSLNRQFLRQKKTSKAFWNIMRSNSPVMKSWKVFHDILDAVLWRFMFVSFVQKSSHSWCSIVFFCAGNIGCFNNLKNGFLKITRTCSMSPLNCTVWPSGKLGYYFRFGRRSVPMHAAIPLFDTSRVYGFRSVLPARECVLSN